LHQSLWERFHRLQFTRTGGRLCGQYDENGSDRSDLERAQCDTWRLGCLAQFILNLRNPRDEDEYRDGTIMAIMNKVDAMEEFQNKFSYILSKSFFKSHMLSTLCGNFAIRMRGRVARVEGLELEI